jgi:hypothetical protein
MIKKKITTFVCMLLLIITGTVTGCVRGGGVSEVTFDQLFSNPGIYSNRDVKIEGFYFHGFETLVLSERLEYSGFATGHLVPKGRTIWVSGGIPKDVYDKLSQQDMAGPLERYGKVRITGKFEYGDKYGHFGGFDRQITPVETAIFPWSPPASETLKEGFAIYLTKGDIPPAQMEALSQVNIAEQPIITIEDVITYNAQTHELKLTTNAFEHISQLDVPVRGKSFLVCVDKRPIYWGAFWTPISSISFDGVTIWKPLRSKEPNVITLELGYPSTSFYGGDDPRNNEEVMKSLEQAGRLISKLSITTVDRLPHSMKGYELYSWLEDNQWHFTLITGTNRNKTREEIISNNDFISEAGWVQIHVEGVDAIKAALSKLTQNESVSWLAGMRSEPSFQSGVNIILPPGPTIDTIKEYAELCGLNFVVHAP